MTFLVFHDRDRCGSELSPDAHDALVLEYAARLYAGFHGIPIIEVEERPPVSVLPPVAPLPAIPIPRAVVSSLTDILPCKEIGQRIGLADGTCVSRAIRKGELTKVRSPITGRAGVSLAAAEAWSAQRKLHPHRTLRLSERSL